MKELLSHISRWKGQDKAFAIARVIQTWGSSPRPVGSALIISNYGEMAGSVSGGCVEGAVVKEAKMIISSGQGKRLSYGVSDDEAWSVGLTCGGKIQVYLQSVDADGPWEKLFQSLSENKGGVLITALTDGKPENYYLSAGESTSAVPRPVMDQANEGYNKRKHQSLTYEGIEYFIQVFPRRSQLLIIGAAHIAAALVQLAHLHDFESIVIDPRSAFAENTAFEVKPDQMLVNYPSEAMTKFSLDSYTYAVVLSHDPKIDDDALHVLLKSKAAFIGALGSRKSHEKRIARLVEAGLTDQEIKRIESPVGVDIHALGAREIALSIMASIIKSKNQFI